MASTQTHVLPDWMSDIHPDFWTEPVWQAYKEHRLVMAKCAKCGTFRSPPRPFCHNCQTQEIDWEELPGTGVIFTFTVVRHAVVPELSEYVPYGVAVVDVDGAPDARVVAAVVDSDLDKLQIGDRVEVVWDDVHENVTIPRFRRAVG